MTLLRAKLYVLSHVPLDLPLRDVGRILAVQTECSKAAGESIGHVFHEAFKKAARYDCTLSYELQVREGKPVAIFKVQKKYGPSARCWWMLEL